MMFRAMIYSLFTGGLIYGAIEAVKIDGNLWESLIFLLLALVNCCLAVASVVDYEMHKNWR